LLFRRAPSLRAFDAKDAADDAGFERAAEALSQPVRYLYTLHIVYRLQPASTTFSILHLYFSNLAYSHSFIEYTAHWLSSAVIISRPLIELPIIANMSHIRVISQPS